MTSAPRSPRKPRIAQIAPAASSPAWTPICRRYAMTRRAFLDRQLEGWEHRYACFLATEGASEPAADPADPPHAADFLLAITALAARRIALGGDRS
jgi:hypothetical protein